MGLQFKLRDKKINVNALIRCAFTHIERPHPECHWRSSLWRCISHHVVGDNYTQSQVAQCKKSQTSTFTYNTKQTHIKLVSFLHFCGNILPFWTWTWHFVHSGRKLFLSISGRKENLRKTILTKRLKRNRWVFDSCVASVTSIGER